jgi:hypothetical protein
MTIHIETKFTLEIRGCHWVSSDFNQLIVKLYDIVLRDQRSKKILQERRVYEDEILHHVKDILPNHFNLIQNQIKSQLNLN